MNKNLKQMDLRKKPTGFKNVSSNIAKKEGISKDSANAILASSTKKVSAKAKKSNPKLKKVK